MADLDPYRTLGVPRSASREEIARAYRALAKAHHPDRGAAASPRMSRINEAWHILSDPARRARWDRAHAVVAPPHWSSAPVESARRPIVEPAPPSRWDSGWTVLAAVLGAAMLVGVLMVGVFAATAPPDGRGSFEGPEVSFRYPAGWSLRTGDGSDPARHRVVAHLVSFSPAEEEWCTSFADPCLLTDDTLPAGTASVVITAWEGGTPPVAEPVTRRPFGLDADAVIGGQPAAYEEQRFDGGPGFTAWWQLSPPGFPDRWIEVRADIAGFDLQTSDLYDDVQAMLDTLEFTD